MFDSLNGLNLHYLNLSNNSLTSISSLTTITSLTYLDVSNNPIYSIPSLPKLHSLNMDKCPLLDNRQTILALHKLTTLTCLTLPQSTITTPPDPYNMVTQLRLYRGTNLYARTQRNYYKKLMQTPSPKILDCDVYIRILLLFLPQLLVFNKERLTIDIRKSIAYSVNVELSLQSKQSVITHVNKQKLGRYEHDYGRFISSLREFNPTPYKRIAPAIIAPRQLEFNKFNPQQILVGTTEGKLYIVDSETNTSSQITSPFRSSPFGMCWCGRQDISQTAIIASDDGIIAFYDFEKQKEPLHTINEFERITSIHMDSMCDKFISSGFETNVNLFDFETRQLLHVYGSFHTGSVNVAKFANISPFLFTTCSFDSSAAIWDIRTDCTNPVIRYRSQTPLITTVFSGDDLSILIAGEDNYVEDVDIRTNKGTQMLFERRWVRDSYCRAYYCNGNDLVIASNTNECTLHVARRYDGKRVIDCHFDVDGNQQNDPTGFISVRSNPFKDYSFVGILIDDDVNPLGLYECSLI
ncbi:Uncharacterized protein QTN25_006045 [Entamoeba marina]